MPALTIELDDDQWTYEGAIHSIEPAVNSIVSKAPDSEPVVRVWRATQLRGPKGLIAVFPLRAVKAIHCEAIDFDGGDN